MQKPNVSIIILNWNGKDDTIECLESLRKISYPNYEIIVVDNGSEGDDVNILKKVFGNYINIIEADKNYGFAEGNNIGMRYALKKMADYILLLNNDTVVDSEFLSELVRAAESDSKIGIVGPKIYFYSDPDKIWFAGGNLSMWRCKTWHTGLREIDKGQYDSQREADYITGCALLVKKQVIEKIGMLYSNYFAYYEEVDWCIHAKKVGYKVKYVPRAKLWHKISSSTGGGYSPTKAFLKGRNSIIFMKKNAEFKHWLVFPFFACGYLIRTFLRETLRGNGKAVIALMKGIASNLSLNKNE